ncbi:ATP-dependent helicase HrpA [Alcanivorax hongdengensis A-11-3]|uniref:ATP-dependent helicase HrpA n=1 Tax=Alcanivorax hongdengensis A-11-3 TaxID=1177179 RepID=L0W7S6_9GAMM|nr:ATP-dependent RNA helicase HrpA [Alcanivorax hongdengensis]EKF73004.1 ATP-dependent helicase HrpA [Alcanivorax hongdengensis A-11-3]
MRDELKPLYQQLDQVRAADRHRLRRRLDGVGRKYSPPAADKVARAIAASTANREVRRASVPTLNWPDLPVVASREDIKAAIRDHQVVVIAGETGSGKTTQLPKICLELGRGIDGTIGHTQPRRLAARAVASRVAEELGSPVGDRVGFKVRFSEQVGEHSLIKVLTDGMLLNEIQQDRFLNDYDTLIIDEAHERSLNIDFLLGYLKQLLPRRPDLKLIITSATIDHERFARHFGDAPVLEVSGRTYPVDIRYRPPSEGQELSRQIEEVLLEIQREERGNLPPARDVLVFLPGEREIRDAHHHLRRCQFGDTEFLPLYARLSQAEQHRIFAPHRGRRVVLSTNVAETSLTVPGIRYVIDAGTARISRYSVHSKVQRLPVEPVSQASANQRAGRSGRIMEGICYRLYEEEDFLNRPAFTDPEIQRTNLAAVILQMADLRLGRVEDFPFIEPPDGRLIRDGYRLLEELSALGKDQRLTPLGRQLARFPLDPTLSRMLVAAADRKVLREALIVVAALAAQDPRERPHDRQQQADQAHQPFISKDSDFLFFINLWQWADQQREALSRNQYEKQLKKQFLSPSRMREWRDIHRQLLLLSKEQGWALNAASEDLASVYTPLHQALLTGLIANVMQRTEEGEWLSTRNRKPLVWPGSALSKTKARWLVAAEQVETSRLFARTVARIEPEWVEQVAGHLIKRQYFEPHWSKKRGCAMAKEQINLFGLILAAGRRVNYGPIDPQVARELMVREGLVVGHLNREPPFVRDNRLRLEKLEEMEHKLRRRDILVDEQARVDFYLARLPEDIYSLAGLISWYQKTASPAQRRALIMGDDFLLSRSPELAGDQFPDHLSLDGLSLPLQYSFDPTGERDGVTLVVPHAVLNQVPAERLDWLVPGLLREKLEAMIRALPKARRRHFVPVPDYVSALLDTLTPDQPLLPAMTRELQRMTGVRVEQEEWQQVSLADHLRMRIQVVDSLTERPAILAEGRSLEAVRDALAGVRAAPLEAPTEEETAPLRGQDWIFGTLAETEERPLGGMTLRRYPALHDDGDAVVLAHDEDLEQARWAHRWGTARLLALRLSAQLRDLRKHAGQQPGFQKLKGEKSAMARQALDQALLRLLAEHFQLQTPVRSEAEFRARLDAHRGDFVPAAQQQLVAWGKLFAQYRTLMGKLEKNFPLAWAHAHRDLKQQLSALFCENFLQDVPAEWLAEYPRFLQAVEHRLDKLGGQIGKDRTHTAELQAYHKQYQTRAAGRPLWQQSEPLQTFRWMLEEYRVSLFAQQLGTRLPVSAKRLNKQWELC